MVGESTNMGNPYLRAKYSLLNEASRPFGSGSYGSWRLLATSEERVKFCLLSEPPGMNASSFSLPTKLGHPESNTSLAGSVNL